MTSYCRTPLTFSAHQKNRVGDSKFSALTSDHMGWLLCDGRTLSVSEFQFLFDLIGYSFGGSGTQFQLPNAAGKVPGAIGVGRDQNLSTFSTILGVSTGEYMHQLTIPEMPSHNHGTTGTGGQIATNNSTSIEYTKISTIVSTTGVTDLGHAHGYIASFDTNHENAVSLTNSGNNQGVYNATTNTGYANLNDPGHIHDVFDPGHRHTMNPAGGDARHNNVQPTIFMGNMFIYCGRVNYPSFLAGYPYTIGQNIY